MLIPEELSKNFVYFSSFVVLVFNFILFTQYLCVIREPRFYRTLKPNSIQQCGHSEFKHIYNLKSI